MKISKMFKVNLILVFLVAIFSLPMSAMRAEAAGRSCVDLFRSEASYGSFVGRDERRMIAGLLKQNGFSDLAYAVQWKLKEASNPGPYPTSGEFLSVAVPSAKVASWLQTVGKNTIGFAVEGFPSGDRGFHSATLRIGERLYLYYDIQGDGSFQNLREFSRTAHFTEATFVVSDAEMRAIEAFIEARAAGEIVAKKKVRGGPDVGERIHPDFDYSKNTLTAESCAGACTSFVNPLWLQHYDGAQILQRMADRLGLESTPVAKAMVWRHGRKPNLMAITQVGLNVEDGIKFIEKNKWGQLKGMPVYSLIPDPPSGENNQVISRRLSLGEWLALD